jgi:hypothetical protein
MGVQAFGGTDPNKVNSLNQGIEQIKGLGQGSQLPAVNSSNQQQQGQADTQDGNATCKTPEDGRTAYQSGKLTKDQARELISAFSGQ